MSRAATCTPSLHRVTLTVTLPHDPTQHVSQLRLIEAVLLGDDRVELFDDSTAPLPIAGLTRLVPSEFGWPEPRPNAIGQFEVTISRLMHCPDTRYHSTHVVLMNWVDGFRNLRLGTLRSESQEIRPQTPGLHHADARAATSAA